MAGEAKSTAEEDTITAKASLYDLEFRERNDDAWYSVYVVLDARSEKLIVNHLCDREAQESFAAADFATEEQVDELLRRFRPLSAQLQDDQCGKLGKGTVVCASHCKAENDLRFFDAVVEEVYHEKHSLTGGEEECRCTFLLCWQHGRGCGTLTLVNIENICILRSSAQIDPRISAFAVMAKEKITSCKSIPALACPRSASLEPSSGKSNSSISLEKQLESSQNSFPEMEKSVMTRNINPKIEDIEMISCYNSCNSQDEDMGPEPYNVDGLAKDEGQHLILINHLEKDLDPSTIQRFIYQRTSILPKVFVFPTLLSEPFARGAIVADSMNAFQIIEEFLDNPNHLIVSSRGRPWVITEKALMETFKTSIWNLIPNDKVETQCKGTYEKLQMVDLGTESYEIAKQLKDLFSEFIDHEMQVCKRLVLEEEKIVRSFQQGR